MNIQNREQIIERLKNIPFLKLFKKDYLGEILAQSKLREYRPEDCIISEGSLDKCIYILLSGEVKVVKKNEDIAHLNYIGDIFGELAVINNEPRMASVYAVQPTNCLTIDTSKFEELLPEDRNAIYSVIYRIFTEVLADRLKATTAELAQIHYEVTRYQETLNRMKQMTGQS
ncbi:MAG: cyclic nucleotide-binding domain-containing protein [Verrucomicrobiota bacterium]